MLNHWFIRQIIGTLNLACPFILLYKFMPHFALTAYGIVFYSSLVGLYLIYINYNSAKKQLKTLLYRPSGSYREEFNSEIERCGLDHRNVSLRYAYTGDNVAMTIFNGIILDPLVWKNLEDPERIKASDVVEKYIIPTIAPDKLELLSNIQNKITTGAQKFIFRHELGHVFYNYSYKKILLSSLIGVFVTAVALVVAHQIMPRFDATYTFVICLALSCLLDLILGFLVVNLFFKTNVEYQADLFAAKFSNSQETEEAACYFENYEKAAQVYRNNTNSFLKFIPTTILTGYIDGVRRAQYLRNSINLK